MLQENDPTSPHQTVQALQIQNPDWVGAKMRRPRRPAGWWLSVAMVGLILGLSVGLYLLAPIRTNILLLGIDRRPGETNASRTDTMILTTVEPLQPYVGMLSIPRDLWVTLPDGSQNRINTAHFFAEAASPGSGPEAAKQVVAQNFGVTVDNYLRLNFAGLRDFVDTLGGVQIDLPQAMSGYSPGRHQLDGEQALAFVRDRAGSDDFARMGRGQLFLRAVLKEMASPATWPHLPVASLALLQSIDSDVPVWQWPRLVFALIRAGPDGIDGRVITRDMAHGFTTDAGAQVLAPDWPRINPVLKDMFNQ
jgi:LCP family protein required for cell wall assembly